MSKKKQKRASNRILSENFIRHDQYYKQFKKIEEGRARRGGGISIILCKRTHTHDHSHKHARTHTHTHLYV